jgi:lysophospholipase L1-like esterase
VLIVGNSTLRFGVDVNGLRSKLGPGYECRVLSVDATTYPDWYFGLKELFRKGAQPDYVVIMLPANNVLEFFPVPEFSPYYLIAAHDIPALSHADHLNASAESDVAFEHFSVFFASRNALRAVVKQRLFLGFETMATKYMKQKGSARLAAVVTNRMRDLKSLCDSNGTKIVFIVPPTNQPDEAGADRVLALARKAGMPAGMPWPDRVVPPNDYVDGFHLNDVGRDVFTANLANYLREQLANPSEGPTVAQIAGD